MRLKSDADSRGDLNNRRKVFLMRLPLLALFGFVFVLGNAQVAFAAPQVLAALPMGEKHRLICDDGVCGVEVSAICLQPRRPAPTSHTPYRVRAEDADAVRLTGLTADGRVVALPAAMLKISSLRSQTSVRFFMNKDVLEQSGLHAVSIGIERMIALLPEPLDGDTPQTVEDIAAASSGMHRVGAAWAEMYANNLAIARITARVGNELPKSGGDTTALSNQLMDRAFGYEANLSAGVLGSARRLVKVCQRRSRFMPMRGCLEEYHDQIMLGLNGKYWSALKPAS